MITVWPFTLSKVAAHYSDFFAQGIIKIKSYSEKLLDDRWDKKRRRILAHDKCICKWCRTKSLLHVHHLIYIENREPWEYRDADLISLCENCHSDAHETGSQEQVGRGQRAIAYPYPIRSLAEVITQVVG